MIIIGRENGEEAGLVCCSLHVWDWMLCHLSILEKNDIYSSAFLFYLYNIIRKTGLKEKNHEF